MTAASMLCYTHLAIFIVTLLALYLFCLGKHNARLSSLSQAITRTIAKTMDCFALERKEYSALPLVGGLVVLSESPAVSSLPSSSPLLANGRCATPQEGYNIHCQFKSCSGYLNLGDCDVSEASPVRKSVGVAENSHAQEGVPGISDKWDCGAVDEAGEADNPANGVIKKDTEAEVAVDPGEIAQDNHDSQNCIYGKQSSSAQVQGYDVTPYRSFIDNAQDIHTDSKGHEAEDAGIGVSEDFNKGQEIGLPIVFNTSLPALSGQLEPDKKIEAISADSLLDMISQIPSPTDVNISGLITCAMKRLSKSECKAISLLGRGSSNNVYLIEFDDGSDCAASVPNCSRDNFSPAAKRSEIATMQFVRESGLYPRVPVPKVYSWDLSYTNSARSPYVLTEAIHGLQVSTLSRTQGECHLYGLDALSTQDQMSVTRSLAQLHADLYIPLPQFSQIGGLVRRKADKGKFTIGPLFSYNGDRLGGPFSNLYEYWTSYIEKEVSHAMDEWHDRKEEELSKYNDEGQGTPRDFSACLHYLSVLIQWFIPPESQQVLVLAHPDLALRNIIFDPDDYNKIIGVLDWSGASIVPLVLSGRFPKDLLSRESDNPFGQEDVNQTQVLEENWSVVPFDWTYLGQDDSEWPESLRALGSAVVRHYYLRQYFSAYYAIKCNYDITRASLFQDSAYYLKFHEILSEGWSSWLEHRDWIADTYLRIKWKVVGYSGAPIIVGPNVYGKRVQREPLYLDLGNVDTETKRFSPFTKL